MRWSIALCTFNGSKYLSQQLASISEQSRLPDEIVVCDDRSIDGTVRIVEAFASKGPVPVRLFVNSANLGPTANFEQAIARCRGDLIALSDQDDVWHSQKLEQLEAALEGGDGGAVAFSDAELVDAEGKLLGSRLWAAYELGPRDIAEIHAGRGFSVLVRRHAVTGATMAFRGQLRHLVLPIPQEWVHDAWIALLGAGVGRLVAVEEPLIRYRIHAAQRIGVTSRGPSLGKSPGGYSSLATACAQAYHRLLERGGARYSAADLQELGSRLHHLRQRSRLPARLGDRLVPVLDELVAGRYHRFSRGLWSAAKDLLG